MSVRGQTIGEIVRQWADRAPDNVAFRCPGRADMTYGALVQQMDGLQGWLNEIGVGRTDLLALVSGSVSEAIGAYYPLIDLAGVAPLNPKLAPAELRVAISQVGFSAALVSRSLPDVADFLRQEGLPVIEFAEVPGGTAMEVAFHGERFRECRSPGRVGPGDIATVQMTSGTTGRPKAAVSTHGALAHRCKVRAEVYGLKTDDVATKFSPTYVSSLYSGVSTSLVAGAVSYLGGKFEPERFLRELPASGVTWYQAGSTFHRALLKVAANYRSEIADSKLRMILSGTIPLSPELKAEMEEVFGVPVRQQYSTTETSTIAINPMPPEQNKPGSVGRPADYLVEIRDDDHNPLPVGVTGNIAVKGAGLFEGYLNDPTTTSEAMRDGWFYTGDSGFLDEDGYLELVGRKKELINRGGEKISPLEVETALLEHPEIVDCVAFGVSHPTLGQVAAAAVVLGADGRATPGDLRRFARERLTAFKVPTPILIADEIPRTQRGKVSRVNAAAHFELDANAAVFDTSRVVAPARSDPLIEALLKIWSGILENDAITPWANFIESGGDSLRAEALLIEVEVSTGVALGMDVMFDEGATIEGMARLVRARQVEEQGLRSASQAHSILARAWRRLRWEALRLFRPNHQHVLAAKMDFSADIAEPPDIDEVIRRIDRFSRAWRGTWVSRHPPIVMLNPNASGSPLLWCCNNQSEFEALSRSVSPDRPVLIIRSIHNVLASHALRPLYYKDLVAAYRRVMREKFGAVPEALGGSCGGHAIVEEFARQAIAEGFPPPRLYLQEAEPEMPYPGQVTMFFGDASPTRNPFYTERDPSARWTRDHHRAVWHVLPADHVSMCWGDGATAVIQEVEKALRAAEISDPFELVDLSAPLVAATKTTI